MHMIPDYFYLIHVSIEQQTVQGVFSIEGKIFNTSKFVYTDDVKQVRSNIDT